MNTLTRLTAVLAIGAAIMTGTATAASAADPTDQPGIIITFPPTTDPSVLTGRTFVAYSVTDAFGTRPIVDGTEITLNFTAKQIGANAGCNAMSAPVDYAGNRLVINTIISTKMACDPARMQQESWVSRFLTSDPTWFAISEIPTGTRLFLSAPTGTMQLLERLPATPIQ